MDIDPSSIIRIVYRNVMGKRAKGTIGIRIIAAAHNASSAMIGQEGGMDDNILVQTNENKNTSTEVNKTGSGVALTRNGTNTTVDANVVDHFHRTTRVVNVSIRLSHVSVCVNWIGLSSVQLALGLQEGKLGVTPAYVADTSHSKWVPPKHEHVPRLTRRRL